MNQLVLRGVSAGYGPVRVLQDVSLEVEEGETCVILGTNGAGKTTMLRAVSGLIWRRGAIHFQGRSLTGLGPAEIARAGIGHVPQGRGTFNDLTVNENLRLGAVLRWRSAELRRDFDFVLDLFPRLRERASQLAGSLSGGEQQMLAIGRAILAAPRLLLLDEPSLGLAPLLTQQVFDALARLRRERGLTLLLVEQNAHLSLAVADRAYVLEAGRIVESGAASELMASDSVRHAYLGI